MRCGHSGLGELGLPLICQEHKCCSQCLSEGLLSMGGMFGSDYSHLISQEISITLQRTHGRKASPKQHTLGACRHHKDIVRTSSESGLQGSLQICSLNMLS